MRRENRDMEGVRPIFLDAVTFRLKSRALQARRLFADITSSSVKRCRPGADLAADDVIAESRMRLWTEIEPGEKFLVAGKIQNLRLAVARLNGVEVPAGETFSFWKNIGRATRGRGYVPGRELREGCIIPNVGGGLCQLSNALYDAAMKADFEIVERHAHTQVISGSLAEQGRDATVFWNYVDLRFRSPEPFRIEASLTGDHLAVTFRGKKVMRPVPPQATHGPFAVSDINSCASCGIEECLRSIKIDADLDFGRKAFLVDEFLPEFDAYISRAQNKRDELFIPLDGNRFRKRNYAWSTDGFAAVRQSLLTTAVRSYRSRKLATQGAARQKDLLAMYERLAASYAAKLTFDVLHVVVQQSLLPFLWKNGALGGRTFDVLMTALPMTEIQKRLDHAKQLHPESKTLADFRADDAFLKGESDALAAARRIITPHTAIAAMFGNRAEQVPWKTPAAIARPGAVRARPTIVFPATTVGRKGCYELREAIRGLDVKVVTLGPNIEGDTFWNGFDMTCGDDEWPQTADLVVLPAFIEHRPRRLLLAAASGIPVIASPACGVDCTHGVTMVPAGHANELRDAIVSRLTH